MPVKSRISRKPNLLNDASADVSGGMLVVLTATVVRAPGADVGAGCGKVDKAAVEAVGKERRLVAGAWSGRQQNDVSAGPNAGSL